MRVIIFSIAPSPYQRDLFSALAQQSGLNVEVYYWEKDTPDSPWQVDSLHPHERVLPGKVWSIAGKRIHWSRGLPKIEASTCVLLNGYVNLGIIGMLRKMPTATPCVFFGERFNAPQQGMKHTLHALLRSPLKRIDAAIAIGKTAADQYQTLFPDKPILNQPYAIDTRGFENRHNRPPNSPKNLLFCGQLIERKGIDILLVAFERLLETLPQTDWPKLTLVGRCDHFETLTQHLRPETRARLDYPGFVQPVELAPFFNQADLFILPSRYDGWGVVINQAIASGLPIIATDQVGAARDLVNSKNGILIPPADVQALTEAMSALLARSDTWPEIAAYNAQIAAEISPQGAADRIAQFLKSLPRKR